MPTAAERPSGDRAEMSFWDHLDALRSVVVRMAVAVGLCGIVAFALKDWLFGAILAPSHDDFVLYRAIDALAAWTGWEGMVMEPFRITLINTELAAQFMAHVSVALATGALLTAPYLAYVLFGFIQPALYAHEIRHTRRLLVASFLLFYVGIAVNYLLIFPVSFRFLGTYQVAASVINTINLSSYLSTFMTLSLMTGLVFEVPLLALFLARMGLITPSLLCRYRRHALVGVVFLSAVITPPDLFSLVMLAVPMYLLYEASILVVRRASKRVSASASPVCADAPTPSGRR